MARALPCGFPAIPITSALVPLLPPVGAAQITSRVANDSAIIIKLRGERHAGDQERHIGFRGGAATPYLDYSRWFGLLQKQACSGHVFKEQGHDHNGVQRGCESPTTDETAVSSRATEAVRARRVGALGGAAKCGE